MYCIFPKALLSVSELCSFMMEPFHYYVDWFVHSETGKTYSCFFSFGVSKIKSCYRKHREKSKDSLGKSCFPNHICLVNACSLSPFILKYLVGIFFWWFEPMFITELQAIRVTEVRQYLLWWCFHITNAPNPTKKSCR